MANIQQNSFKAYFISDVHLGSDMEPKAFKLIEFFKTLENQPQSKLFLVGDIFDLWIGDHKSLIKRYQKVIDSLQALLKAGIEIHYYEGNHDLHLQKYFGKQLGMKIIKDKEEFCLGTKRFRVEHGDLIDPEDKGYRFLRWFLRTPPMKAFSLYMPDKIVSKIGERASHASRDYTSNTKILPKETIIKKHRDHAQKVYKEMPFDYMVSGHTHVKDIYEFKTDQDTAVAINLGSWFDEPKVLQVTQDGFEFVNLG